MNKKTQKFIISSLLMVAFLAVYPNTYSEKDRTMVNTEETTMEADTVSPYCDLEIPL